MLNNFEASKFRDTRNTRRTMSLFWEYNKEDCLYTLSDKDRGTIPSLRRLYMEMEDLTEYQFATTYFESWDHWRMLIDSKWFLKHLLKWRTELELKIKAKALAYLVGEAKKGSFAANKFIATKGWIQKETEPSRRGRPSKDEIDRLAQEELFNRQQVEEDLKRLEIN